MDILRKSFFSLFYLTLFLFFGCGPEQSPDTENRETGVSAAIRTEEWVYVTNEDSEEISIISTVSDSVLATIPVNKRPRGLKLGPDPGILYVATSGSPKCPPWISDEACEKKKVDKSQDGISEINVLERKVLRILPSGSDPEQFDITTDGKRLFISNEDIDKASIVSIERAEMIKEVPVGREPEGVKLSPDDALCYVTGETDHNITVIDTQSGEVKTTIKVGLRPRDILFTRDGRRAYVSGEADASVTVIDVAKSEAIEKISLPVGAMPVGLALSPDENTLYVANGRGKNVSAIDLSTKEIKNSVSVGRRPWGIAITSDGRRLYTANGPSNNVSIIDAKSLQLIDSIAVGEGPWGVVIGPKPE